VHTPVLDYLGIRQEMEVPMMVPLTTATTITVRKPTVLKDQHGTTPEHSLNTVSTKGITYHWAVGSNRNIRSTQHDPMEQ